MHAEVAQPVAASEEPLRSVHGYLDECQLPLLTQLLPLAPRTGESSSTASSELLTSKKQHSGPGATSSSSMHGQSHSVRVDTCPSKAKSSKYAMQPHEGKRCSAVPVEGDQREDSGPAENQEVQHSGCSAPSFSSPTGYRPKEDSELTADDFRPTKYVADRYDFHPLPPRSQGGTSPNMGMFVRPLFCVPGGAPTMMPRSCNPQLLQPQSMLSGVPMNFSNIPSPSYAPVPPMTVQHAAKMILDDAHSRSQGMIER